MRDRFTLERARDQRSTMTDAERRLWDFLRRGNLGCRFRRQHPIGPYIADFACIELGIVIEVDGGQHADEAAYDAARDRFIRTQDFDVLRFWSNEVLQNTEGVLSVVLRMIQTKKSPPSCPSPAVAEEGT